MLLFAGETYCYLFAFKAHSFALRVQAAAWICGWDRGPPVFSDFFLIFTRNPCCDCGQVFLGGTAAGKNRPPNCREFGAEFCDNHTLPTPGAVPEVARPKLTSGEINP